MSESFGHRLRRARKARGLGQEEVAALGGPARTTLSRLERGAGQKPERYTIESLATVLQVRTEWLISGQGPMTEEGAAKHPNPYLADTLDTQLLRKCCIAVLESMEEQGTARPPAAKLGAVIAEVYTICHRDGRQPTDDLVASFMRVLLA